MHNRAESFFPSCYYDFILFIHLCIFLSFHLFIYFIYLFCWFIYLLLSLFIHYNKCQSYISHSSWYLCVPMWICVCVCACRWEAREDSRVDSSYELNTLEAAAGQTITLSSFLFFSSLLFSCLVLSPVFII